MRGNGRVFISHAHEDNARCGPLLAVLDAWNVDYWFDTRQLDAGDDLSQSIQRAIAERDIFLRVCTAAAQRSYWVKLESGAFRGLQAKQHRTGDAASRVLINLILDAAYEPEPFDYAHMFIDATSKPRPAWLDELRRALGIASPTGREPAAPAPAASGPALLVVDASGLGDFTTISAAIQRAQDGDTLLIRPGHYAEELVVAKALTLRGDGASGAVVIEGNRGSALRYEAPSGQSTRIENLTFRQSGAQSLDCLAIVSGRLDLISCDISTQTAGACVNITSKDEAVLRGNTIHDGHGWGVFLGGTGNVTLEDNEISAHAYSGITIHRGAYAVARRNRITRNAQHAIRIYADGGGTFEDNDLRGNYLATWNIDAASFGQVMRERNKG